MKTGRSRVQFSHHFITGVPTLDLIEERLYPATRVQPLAYIFQVTTKCTAPDASVSDIIALHCDIATRYRDFPALRVSGAIRM
jgi:hypothetical protein